MSFRSRRPSGRYRTVRLLSQELWRNSDPGTDRLHAGGKDFVQKNQRQKGDGTHPGGCGAGASDRGSASVYSLSG